MVEFEWTGSNPLSVLPIASVLSDFADIDFRVEVSSESFVVVASVAIDDVEVVHFVEVVFSSICSVNSRAAWVETATEDSAEAGFFEAVVVSPLPRVFEVSFVFRLVVGLFLTRT